MDQASFDHHLSARTRVPGCARDCRHPFEDSTGFEGEGDGVADVLKRRLSEVAAGDAVHGYPSYHLIWSHAVSLLCARFRPGLLTPSSPKVERDRGHNPPATHGVYP